MCVHCMTKPFVIQTLLLPFRLCQIVDLAGPAATDRHQEHVLLWSHC